MGNGHQGAARIQGPVRIGPKRVGIVGAMEVEVADLIANLEGARPLALGVAEAWLGDLAGVPAAVVRSGVGKAAAAAVAQALVSSVPLRALVNTGVAGALDPRLAVGDVVVSASAVYHDVDVSALGYPLGKVPGFPKRYKADRGLVRAFLESASRKGARAVEGGIASGDRFVNDPEDRARIRALTGASCCEMEGAPIAQVAYMNGVPFAICRAISDGASGTSPIAYARFEREAAKAMGALVLETLPGI